MKKTLLTIFVTILSIVAVNAQDLSLKEILKKHFETIGQEKLLKVNSIKITGKQQLQGMEFPFTVFIKRPGKIRIEAEVQGSTFVQAYNGTSGYMIAPWTGSNEPQDLNEDQLKDMKDQSNMDGELFDYEKKGSKLELIGSEDLAGIMVYKMKLTAKPDKEGAEGNISYLYIDKANFVILKTTSNRNYGGNQMEVDNYTSNYKQIDGISFPYNSETKSQGNTMSQITVEGVTFNVEVADEVFEKPVK